MSLMRKEYPEGFICNIQDKYSNGFEIMLTLQTRIKNKDYPDVRSLVEEAIGLPKGSLSSYVQCMAPMFEKAIVGDICESENPRFGKSYLLYWNEMIAFDIQPEAEYDYSCSLGAVMQFDYNPPEK